MYPSDFWCGGWALAVTDCPREKHFSQFYCCSLGLARRQRRSWRKASQSKARGVTALGPAPTGCLLSGKGGVGSLPGWGAVVSHGLCRFAGHRGQETGQLLSRHQDLPPRTFSAPSWFWTLLWAPPWPSVSPSMNKAIGRKQSGTFFASSDISEILCLWQQSGAFEQ